MKKLLLAALLAGVAACHGHSSSNTTPSSGTTAAGDDPQVDPTLPSWAPKSCVAYHKAVVEASGCYGIDTETREQIKTSYDTANNGWQAMHDAQQADIDQVQASCASEEQKVRAAMEGKCGAPATSAER